MHAPTKPIRVAKSTVVSFAEPGLAPAEAVPAGKKDTSVIVRSLPFFKDRVRTSRGFRVVQ
jgi:hypothetical protein